MECFTRSAVSLYRSLFFVFSSQSEFTRFPNCSAGAPYPIKYHSLCKFHAVIWNGFLRAVVAGASNECTRCKQSGERRRSGPVVNQDEADRDLETVPSHPLHFSVLQQNKSLTHIIHPLISSVKLIYSYIPLSRLCIGAGLSPFPCRSNPR